MEKVIELEGKKFTIRGLKRKEVKQLRREGYNLGNLEATTGEEAMDKVFDMVGLEQQEGFEDLYNSSVLKAFGEIVNMTYLVGETEKN